MKSNNVIEINGKLYDAKSGQPVHSTSNNTKTISKTPGRSMDGMAAAKKARPSSAPAPARASTPKTPPASRSHHKATLSAKRSTTLNRRSVAAPSIHAASVPAESEIATPVASPESTALKHADNKRVKRAANIDRSPAISRFGGSKSTSSIEEEQATTGPGALSDHLVRTHESDTRHQGNDVKKERLISEAGSHALKSQTARPSPTHKKRGKHLTRYATGAFAALLLAGYVAYLNIPTISMKIAAHQAGFAASMPAYKPSGYSLSGPIASNPGEVSLSYASNTDDRNFKLTQQPTTWDSTALLENVVLKKSQNYLTYQDRGLTIYIYDGSNAAWVSNGKLYQVEGNNSNLDTDQLLKLATSV